METSLRAATSREYKREPAPGCAPQLVQIGAPVLCYRYIIIRFSKRKTNLIITPRRPSLTPDTGLLSVNYAKRRYSLPLSHPSASRITVVLCLCLKAVLRQKIKVSALIAATRGPSFG